ncbi:antibiotic biosynthesis monooxygenase [Pikeienuella sp. HZG-20]|uniref:antibiotic biosynthesis monooxygenase family protein n=1 Tax=Paludibacillus litoralis TaxID=3133267 RepID=UPI0030EBC62E
MYIAMNRFRVVKGREAAFEEVWRNRKGRLNEMPGFRTFHLLRGAETEDETLYASHTVWANEADFIAWRDSEQFRLAHAKAGDAGSLCRGHPKFEGFEAVPGA